MSQDVRLEECSAPALRDVAVTTRLHLQVSPWQDSRAGVGYAVHEAGALPRRPVWETFRLLEEGADSMALHPFPAEDHQTPGHGDDNDLVMTIAAGVQDLAQMLLWERGQDATWPSCPVHPRGHALRVLDRRMSWSMKDGVPVVDEDSGAIWTCPKDDFRTPIGTL